MTRRMVQPAVAALLLIGCGNVSQAEPSGATQIRVYDLVLAPAERDDVGSLDQEPRFVRLRPNAQFDVVLDERFVSIADPDFMSVIPTQFGTGKATVHGPYRILCAEGDAYVCGLRFLWRDKYPAAIIFADKPASEAEITAIKHAAESYLQSIVETQRT